MADTFFDPYMLDRAGSTGSIKNRKPTFCLTYCGLPWYKNTKSTDRHLTLRSVKARWPEKPWLHKNRKDSPGRSTAAHVVCRYFAPSFKSLSPTDEAIGKNAVYIIIEYSELCYVKISLLNCAIRKLMAKATGSFSTGDAVRITGVSFRNIDYWARTKFIVPSIAEAQGTGTERRYSFSDLLALRVTRELREAGVSTQKLRRVVEFLRTRRGLTQPLAECRLIVTGTDVQVATSAEKIMSVLRTPGQTSFAFVFDLARTVDEMRQDIGTGGRRPPGRASVAQPAPVRAARRAV